MTPNPSTPDLTSTRQLVQAPEGKPRLGESADDVWKAIKALQGGAVIPGAGILYPTLRVVGGSDHFLSASGQLQVVVQGAGWDGMCARDATAGEIDDFHRDLEKDFVQVMFLSTPGYGSGYGSRQILREVHAPSGLGFKPLEPRKPSEPMLIEQAPPQGLNLALAKVPDPYPVFKVTASMPFDYLDVPEERRDALISDLLKVKGVKGVEYYSDLFLSVEVSADTDALAQVEIQSAMQGAERVAKAHGVWPDSPSPLTPNITPSCTMCEAWLMTPVSSLKLSEKRRDRVINAILNLDGVQEVEHYDNFCVLVRLDDITPADSWLSITNARAAVGKVFEEHKLVSNLAPEKPPRQRRMAGAAP